MNLQKGKVYLTRNGSKACYKENLVTLLSGTLAIGSKYGDLRRGISRIESYSKGSAYHRIWLFMKNNYECE